MLGMAKKQFRHDYLHYNQKLQVKIAQIVNR